MNFTEIKGALKDKKFLIEEIRRVLLELGHEHYFKTGIDFQEALSDLQLEKLEILLNDIASNEQHIARRVMISGDEQVRYEDFIYSIKRPRWAGKRESQEA